jgi:Putative beta-barrel porin 2
MKKIVASVGLVALGTAGTALAQPDVDVSNPNTAKPWSIAATLRGFYDDNVSSIPNHTAIDGRRDSWGFEVSPSAGLAWVREQTTISLGYLYSFKYYDTKPLGNSSHDDQSHTFNAALSHAFSERYKLSVRDSFVIGQEPDILRAGNTFSTFQRIPGDNIRNYGGISFDADLTRLFGIEVGYDNAFYHYHDEGHVGSLASLLDRMEHTAHLDGKYKVLPETTGIAGYAYSQVDYLSNDLISDTPESISSDIRNSRSHYLYLGVDHNFTPDLLAQVRGGARFIDYYNEHQTATSPYFKASLRWNYAPESYLEGGAEYDRTATDVAFLTTAEAGSITLDADTATIYATINHRITPKLYGNLIAQFQNSQFNGGEANNKTEQIYLAGLNLEYRFNQFFSAHAGYNYDRLESDLGRSFDRNRVYMGVTARY